jgi:cell division protein FtsW
MLNAKQAVIKDLEKGFVPLLVWIGATCALIAMQPNFSTMMVIFIIAFMMLFIGNTNVLHIITTGGIGLVFAGIYAVSADYRMQRLLSFFGMNDSTSAAQNENYQLDQALIALGNGGLTGLGPGQNRQSNFLPEPYGDFIFSIIGEEYGFIGLVVILLVFAWVFYRGFKIAKNAPDNFGYFLSAGIVLTFAVYVFVNAGVNTGLLPTTGVPMPFISYGGTAVLFNAAAIGILLNVSAQSNVYLKKK